LVPCENAVTERPATSIPISKQCLILIIISHLLKKRANVGYSGVLTQKK
jgi:hypothetical protein